MSDKEALRTALAILSVFMKMSDEAEALGGATSISGIASLHKMQTAIQNAGPRLAKLALALEASERSETSIRAAAARVEA